MYCILFYSILFYSIIYMISLFIFMLRSMASSFDRVPGAAAAVAFELCCREAIANGLSSGEAAERLGAAEAAGLAKLEAAMTKGREVEDVDVRCIRIYVYMYV